MPRWLSPALAKRDPVPPWRWLFALSFVGVRGVVSLAAALAIPLTTVAGTPFPRRDFIIFVTFAVIVVTLIGQGLALPAVVRWLALPRDAEDERRREQDAEIAARLEALKVGLDRLEGLAADGQTDPDVVAILRARHDDRAGQLPRETGDGFDTVAAATELRAELIAAEREYIYRLLRDGKITDEARRRIEHELDLEEASIALKRAGENKASAPRWRAISCLSASVFVSPACAARVLALRDGKRAISPRRELIGIVVEPLGQAPIRQRSLADAAGAFGAGIDERPASLAFEIRNAGFVHFEINRAVENQREHEAVGPDAGAAEHALHRNRAEGCKKFANEFRVQAADPPRERR